MIHLEPGELEFLIESLSLTQDKSVELTNSYNNSVYNKAALLMEKLKQLL